MELFQVEYEDEVLSTYLVLEIFIFEEELGSVFIVDEILVSLYLDYKDNTLNTSFPNHSLVKGVTNFFEMVDLGVGNTN